MKSLLHLFSASVRCPAGLLAVALFLTVAGAVVAAEESPSQSAGNTELFDRLDTNHDGTIQRDEVAKENRSLFDRLVRKGDENDDRALSRDELLAALIPSRPDRPLEAKESTTLPNANAVRYVLLTMDANRNARIEKDEVPSEFEAAFTTMVERLDRNGDGKLDRQELSRGGPAMSSVAGRYVSRLGIDVDVEVAKLKKSQGAAFDRFEKQLMPLQRPQDPQQARQMFAQLDENGDGKLDPREVPEPLQQPFKRLTRIGDRDGDGKLDQQEFVAVAVQVSKFLQQRQGDERRANATDRSRPKKRRGSNETKKP